MFVTAERDDQNSKVTNFFHQQENLYTEMLWQKKLRGYTLDLSDYYLSVIIRVKGMLTSLSKEFKSGHFSCNTCNAVVVQH